MRTLWIERDEMTKRKISGWMRDKSYSVNARREQNGGTLECDIEAYNARIKARKAEALEYSKNRLKADLHQMEKRFADALKEVWELDR